MTTLKLRIAWSSRFLAGTAAVIALLGMSAAAATASPVPQSPSARFAAQASQYQNSTISRAMHRLPGGTRVSAGEVAWTHRGMILQVPATPNARTLPPDCPAFDVCIWEGKNYTGAGTTIVDRPTSQSWYAVGAVLDAEESVQNETGFRYWMEQYQNHGNELCINHSQQDANTGSANDHDYWGLTTTSTDLC